jgi:hypothetical protein
MMAASKLSVVGDDTADREALVRQVMDELVATPLVREPRREFTAAEAAALGRGGFRLDPVDTEAPADPLAQTIAAYTQLLESSLTVGQAGERLAVNASRIRQRLGARTLYGIKWSGAWRLPAFQFEGDRTVPGLDRVLPRLDPTLHPVALWQWLMEPDPDLVLAEGATPLSPRDWLRSGGSVDAVAGIAAGL